MMRSIKSPKTPTSPRVQQDDATTPSPTTGDMEDDHHPSKKFTVLAKVKEKARKWKHTLSKKRHNSTGTETNTTPSWGVSWDDDDDGHNVEDDNSEFFGTPMHEFDQAPDELDHHKETAPDHKQASSEKDVLDEQEKKVREIGPTVSEASKIDNLNTGFPEAPLSDWEDEQEWSSRGELKWDRGVSVKEYLMDKLKPGEDDRALSQVISDAFSLTSTNYKDHHHHKEDTTRCLHHKEDLILSPSDPPRTVHSTNDSMTNFPVSTNPHEVTEEESTRGRMLQPN